MDIVTFINIIYAGSIFGVFALAAIVALNKNTKENKQFVFFSCFVGIWVLFQFFTQLLHSNNEIAVYLVRLTSIASLFVSTSFIVFVRHHLGKSSHGKLYGVSFLLAPFLLTSLGVKSVEATRAGIAVTNSGPAYTIVLVYASIAFIYGLVLLLINYSKSTQEIKQQNKYFIAGIFQAIMFSLGGSILFANNEAAQIIVPISVFILVLSVSFSILKYRLFDIKTFVVRGFVYTITTTVLVAIYSAISLPIKNYLVQANIESSISTLVEIVLLGIFGMSFYPLKLYFDKVTTRYFFRDHYNVQEVLKNISRILSASVDLDKMLHRVGGIIRNTLQIEHCSFVIDEAESLGSVRCINVGKAVHNISLPQDIDKLFRSSNVVVVEQLKYEGYMGALREHFAKQDIAVVVKLKGVDENGRVDNKGYMILGNKKSGNGFSTQDEKLLDILSGQLAVASENLIHLDEIVHFNIKLQDEITDATKELKVKNKKLKDLDQTKDEFVSMASHQLRTPLTSVKGYLSMVLDGDAGELKPAQKQLLEQAYMSTQRMVYLIADLLNLSRLKTGKFVITPQPTSLAGMIEGEIHQIEETAKSRGHTVSFMCDPSIPDLMLDDMKTRQVIMNFIDNAIYYTPTGGKIQVSLERQGGKVVFKVTDNGIGVAKEDQKELFAKFFRASNARKTRPDGTGLGLYMAKMVIDAEGGDLLFSSEVGKGSTFGFSFDINQLKPPAHQDEQTIPTA